MAEDSGSGRIEFTHDALDRLVKEITPQGIVEYTYDTVGRRSTMTANGQEPVTYGYDPASRLTQVGQSGKIVVLDYDSTGRRKSLTYPNGTSTVYSYDSASHVLNVSHQGPTSALIVGLTYSYDNAGNPITLTRSNGPASLLPDPVQASYDAANEQIQFNGAAVIYDENGSLTFDGTHNYEWDARNRLQTFADANSSANFSYDALGRRISRSINGLTTVYQYDGSEVVAEIQSGSLDATYVRGLNLDEPFIRFLADEEEYYHTDVLRSVIALTDSQGAISTTYRYEPFGNTQTLGASTNPFQFTGRENDGTGLYYFRARYYEPLLHRFISEDPLRAITNLYLYVENRPLIAIDPFGLYTVAVRGGIGGGAVGPSGSGTSMGDIANDLRIGTAGQDVTIYGPGESKKAVADLLSHKGDPTGANVVCHSAGCSKILDELNNNPDVEVDNMVTIDCVGGACGSIPDNVGQNLNYYQDGFLGGGPNVRGNGKANGISNHKVPANHFNIPTKAGVRLGTVACIQQGQCAGAPLGGRKNK